MVDYATNYQLLNILAKNPAKTPQKPAKNPLKIHDKNL